MRTLLYIYVAEAVWVLSTGVLYIKTIQNYFVAYL